MALVKRIEQETGIVLNEGYYRIVGINLQVEGNRAEITVRLYKDQTARQADKMPIQDKVFTTTILEFFSLDILGQSDNNPFKAAYHYLKTLPEYQSAIDA